MGSGPHPVSEGAVGDFGRLTRGRAVRAVSRSTRQRSRRIGRQSLRLCRATRVIRRGLVGPVYAMAGDEDRGRVLVVEHNESVRLALAGLLRAAGFEVIEAADGFLALETLKAVPIAAVVLDVDLPVLDGFTVIDKLDYPPPIVLATAHTYDVEVMERRDKVFGYIQKPVAPDCLVTLVDDAVAAGRGRPPLG